MPNGDHDGDGMEGDMLGWLQQEEAEEDESRHHDKFNDEGDDVERPEDWLPMDEDEG